MKVFFMGGVGYPNQLGAEISKLKLITQSISDNGCDVWVVNRRPSSTAKKEFVAGHLDSVKYINASGISKRPSHFIFRNFYKVKGFFKEFYILKKRKGDAIITGTYSLSLLLFYWLISRLYQYKLYLVYTEYISKMKERQKLKFKLNDFLFEKYGFKFLDGIFPISEILKNVALLSNPKIPWLKLPVMVDFKYFKKKEKPKSNFLLYCGAASYSYTIQLLIDSLEYLIDPEIEFTIVLYGTKSGFEEVNKIIESRKSKNPIRVLSGLEYIDLINYYQNALCLLIPLKDSVQDEARFPHKIAEYAAAARPIITTNFGEVKYYFKDKLNAYIAANDTPELFAEKINYVINNRAKADEVGKNGELLARKYFDSNKVGEEIVKFLNSNK